ncbi:TIGR00282 family metallophosphoesterase [Candidatus Margulisiibacteriota bacterium]
MKILFVGDIIGRPGRNVLYNLLPGLKKKYKPDLIIANVENAASGFGLTEKVYKELVDKLKIDVFTSGNHIWDKKEIFSFIGKADQLIRPYNYPKGDVPGHGFYVLEVNKTKVAVANLIGCVFMGNYDSPFSTSDKMLEEIPSDVKCIIVDMHAEATSEKNAIGWHLDGKVSAVIGTHTHVQTADERILPQGTAYISDAGMCGGIDSVIGVDKEKILERFKTQIPVRFSPAIGKAVFNGVYIEIDTESGKALKCEPIREFTEVGSDKHG